MSKSRARVRHYEKLALSTVSRELREALEVSIDEALGVNDTPSLFAQPVSADKKARIVVGFSGGRDSVALLQTLVALRNKRNSRIDEILALHVHHALSPNANRWARFCREMAESLNVPFKVTHVMVKTKGDGIEAAARKARYEALNQAAKVFNADMIMTAHHEDDRLETFLIQWMRGAGVEGLATFPMVKKDSDVMLVRPFLHVPRALIERYLELVDLPWVEDESNADTTYMRNAIRHEVLPVMDTIRPGFRAAAARAVELVAQTSELLKEVAQEDLKKVRNEKNELQIPKLLALSDMRQTLVLRAWIESFGLVPPSKARLTEQLRQARETHSDTQLTFRMDNFEMRRHGARLVMRKQSAPKKDTTRFETLVWRGEGRYPLPSWNGELVVRVVGDDEAGVAESMLSEGGLQVRPRSGGEKMKIHRARPRKTLKALYQEADIAEFDRSDLPLLWCNDDLIYAAGLGMDTKFAKTESDDEKRYAFEWVPDETLFSLMQS